MNNKKKITVLGQEYVIEEHYHKDDPRLEGFNGYHAPYEKKIVIASEIVDKAEGRNLEPDDTGRIDRYLHHIYRHEIIHAFFNESGITYRYDSDEEDFLVDWIARQFPKMKKIFEELGVAE